MAEIPTPDMAKVLERLAQSLRHNSARIVGWHGLADIIESVAREIAEQGKPDWCQCGSCSEVVRHKSDCALHNMPAMPNGPCDCGALPKPLPTPAEDDKVFNERLTAVVEKMATEAEEDEIGALLDELISVYRHHGGKVQKHHTRLYTTSYGDIAAVMLGIKSRIATLTARLGEVEAKRDEAVKVANDTYDAAREASYEKDKKLEAAEAEVTTLTERLEKAKSGLKAANASIGESAELARHAHALAAKRLEDLKKYGRHEETCDKEFYEGDLPCTCGLTQAIEGEKADGLGPQIRDYDDTQSAFSVVKDKFFPDRTIPSQPAPAPEAQNHLANWQPSPGYICGFTEGADPVFDRAFLEKHAADNQAITKADLAAMTAPAPEAQECDWPGQLRAAAERPLAIADDLVKLSVQGAKDIADLIERQEKEIAELRTWAAQVADRAKTLASSTPSSPPRRGRTNHPRDGRGVASPSTLNHN